jgi:long-chain acyl-CoA synthetase
MDGSPMPGAATLQELLRSFAERGATTAVIAYADDREESCSFAELGEKAARLGAALAARGVARGDAVALIAPNSPTWIAAFWGIVAAGAIALPIDAQLGERDLERMIALGECRWAFATAAVARRLESIAPACRAILLDSDEPPPPGEPWQNLLSAPQCDLPRVEARDVAVIVFTSGTTGTPKAVPLTHANLLTNVRALIATGLVGPGDRALLPLPLYHAYPLTIGMLTPFALGCGIVLPAGVSGIELLAAMRRARVTALLGVPRLYTALYDNLRREMAAKPPRVAAFLSVMLRLARWACRCGLSWPGRLLFRPIRYRLAPQLRLLVSGGAAIEREVEESLSALGWEVLTGYGLVETSSMLTFNPPGAARAGSAGRPVAGMEIRIREPDATGAGEIETRGPSLFSGYRGDPEKTRDAFTEDGWFRTGDLGLVDRDGYLHIAARKSETIVLADGKKLFPEEFEPVYAGAPLIREAALLGVGGALVALVVPDLAAARDMGALRLADALREGLTAAGQTLPSYARLSGFAIAREALPRTQLGKIRRHLLPPLYEAARRPETAAPPADISAADQTLLENPAAAAVWRWLADRFPDRSLRLDTIPQLDLGIDSLGWVEFTLALERELGISLTEREISRIVTLRDLLREAAAAPKSGRRTVPSEADTRWLAPPGPGARLLRGVGEALLRAIMRWGFALRVEDLTHLPPAGPVILCPNHVSYLDPFALGAALPPHRLHKTCWGGWTGVAFTTRLRRWFSRAAHVIPVDPDRAVSSGLAMAGLALERGWSLVWFPEGARSPSGALQRFLPGIGALIERHPVPVVPVSIVGSFAAWPATRRFPRLRPITVRFGKPIDPAILLANPAGHGRDAAIAEAIREAAAELAELSQIKTTIPSSR